MPRFAEGKVSLQTKVEQDKRRVFVRRMNGDQTGALMLLTLAHRTSALVTCGSGGGRRALIGCVQTIVAISLFSFASLSNANAYSGKASRNGKAASAEPAAYIQNLFTPTEYDSNDNVQLVAEGFLSDSCEKLSSVNATIDLETRTLRLDFELTKFDTDGECKSQLTPFETVINVGQVPEGTYIITQNADDEVIGELKVRQAASSNVDDQAFAEVSAVDFKSEMMGSHLAIRGRYSSSCETLSDVDVKVENHIITVKPVVSKEGTNCAAMSTPFGVHTSLDFIPLGRYLLQVRSKNGQAINQLVDVN